MEDRLFLRIQQFNEWSIKCFILSDPWSIAFTKSTGYEIKIFLVYCRGNAKFKLRIKDFSS